MALMVDRNLVKYEDKVADHWPEFAKNGKENITVADVMRHEGGMPRFDRSVEKPEDFWAENIKNNVLGEIIAEQKADYPKQNTKKEYHAFTRGLIVNEIVRRVDPNGRTMGEILRDDVNIDGVYVGLRDEDKIASAAKLTTSSDKYIMRQSFLPKWAGRKIYFNFFDVYEMGKVVKALFGGMANAPPLCAEMTADIFAFFDSEKVRKSEIASAGAQACARGLAKLAAIMANKGQPLKGDERQPLISTETWEQMHGDPKHAFDAGLDTMGTHFTKGGVNQFKMPPNPTATEKRLNINREGFYGWFGLGGSIFQWDPELKIGFSFVPTKAFVIDLNNERGAVLQNIVQQCARKTKKA